MEKHVDPIVNPIDPPSVEYGYRNLFYGSFFWDVATIHARLEEKMRKPYDTDREAIRDRKVQPAADCNGRWCSVCCGIM